MKEKRAKKEYLDYLNGVRKQPFIRIGSGEDFRKRYGLDEE
jgi:hypothetical protein